MCGFDPIDPVELDVVLWRVAEWHKLQELPPEERCAAEIACRAKALWLAQFQYERVAELTAAAREKAAVRRDAMNRYCVRPECAVVEVGDLVLRRDVVREIDLGARRKLTYRWTGLYCVRAISSRGIYYLETPSGTLIKDGCPPERIKRFFV
jgi:hypothetical protein